MVEQQIAEVDSQIKKLAKQVWDFLASMQEVRSGVQQARHKSAEWATGAAPGCQIGRCGPVTAIRYPRGLIHYRTSCTPDSV